MTIPQSGPVVDAETRRTGPVGRLARLVLMLAFVLTFFSIVDGRGSTRFRNPHVLTEPSAWFLTALMYVIFLILIGAIASSVAGPRARRGWQIRAAIASVAVAGGAALVAVGTNGSAWGFPLADVVWWFDVLVIVEQVVAFGLAIGLGTPGCEVGVWGQLLARARGRTAASENGLACIAGLHLVDAWEARRQRTKRLRLNAGS
jgi:hypothetical protein